MCHICERSGTFGTGLLREHRVMEQGAAPETDATLQTFDVRTLKNAETAAPIVAYGYGAGESLKSLAPYATCPPEVASAAVAMGIRYGKAAPTPKCMFLHTLPTPAHLNSKFFRFLLA